MKVSNDLSLQRIDANISPDQINRSIAATKDQIKSHPNDVLQNEYDEAWIKYEERRLDVTEKILKQHPELNPNDPNDRKTLAKLSDAALDKDPEYQKYSAEIQQVLNYAHYQGVNTDTWGLPVLH